MGFDSLLGNPRLKENLAAGAGRGKTSHCYLISGPAGSGKKTLARLLAAAILCEGENKPCLSCSHCRKVMADTHPDFITVTDPKHTKILVEQVRRIREDVFIRPNEGSKKIYLFAQDIRDEGLNALLKVLEEPPSYGVFMLLTEHPEQILTTVRSRSTELRLQALPEDTLRQALSRDFPDADPQTLNAAIFRSGGYLGQAKAYLSGGTGLSPETVAFCKSFASGDSLELLQVTVPMEKWKRDKVSTELGVWLELVQQALLYRSGVTAVLPLAREMALARRPEELLDAAKLLRKSIHYALSNVNCATVMWHLYWALK
ncbi:MAG: DNA polymerase III subunit [Oscillospiraceae bacterium]|nr:DNA polymerase III subunit [Oscillospiraceae bacterium]